MLFFIIIILSCRDNVVTQFFTIGIFQEVGLASNMYKFKRLEYNASYSIISKLISYSVKKYTCNKIVYILHQS